jgi:plasmid stabilization system protein ParE
VNYTVLWTPAAEQRLTTIWTEATDRREVTDAAQRIDEALATNPEDCGESRSSGRRIILVPPLGVTFEVRPDDRIVSVLWVWRFRTSPGGSNRG